MLKITKATSIGASMRVVPRRLMALLCVFVVALGLELSHAQFVIGDRVQVVGIGNVNVRSTAAGTVTGTQSPGVQGAVIGGPQTAVLSGTSYTWWQINFDAGADGWVASPVAGSATLQTVPVYSLSIYRRLDGIQTENGAVVLLSPTDLGGYSTLTGNSSSVRSTYAVYYGATSVTVTAPSAVSGNVFSRWSDCNSQTISTQTAYTFTITAHRGICVEYTAPPPSQGSLAYSISGGNANSSARLYQDINCSANFRPPQMGGSSGTFTALNIGTYCVEAYMFNSGYSPSGTTEYWGKQSQSVTANTTSNVTISRTEPYATSFEWRDAATGNPITSIEVNKPVVMRATVNNPGATRQVRVDFHHKLTTSSTGILCQTTEISMSAGTTATLECQFTPSASGIYQRQLAVRSNASTTWPTDSWAYSSSQQLTVTAPVLHSLSYEVLNINGFAAPANATAVLYRDSACAVTSADTQNGRTGTFNGLTSGAYCIEAYNRNTAFWTVTSPGGGQSEYWGKVSGTLPVAGVVNVRRSEPYAASFSFIDAGTGASVSTIQQGQRTLLRASVTSPMIGRTVRVDFQYRFDDALSSVSTCSSANQFVAAGQTATIDCDIGTLSRSGTLQRQLAVRSDVSPSLPVTDTKEFSATQTLQVTPPAALSLTIVQQEVQYQSQPITSGPIEALRGQRVRLRVRVTDQANAPVTGATVSLYRESWLLETPDMAVLPVAGAAGEYDVFFYVPTKAVNAPLNGERTVVIKADKVGFPRQQLMTQLLIKPPPYGITIVIHGYQIGGCDQDNELVEKISSAVLQRKGKGLRHTYYHETGRLLRRETLSHAGTAADGEWIFAVNWSCQSNNATPGHAEAAAHALWATLKTYQLDSTSHGSPSSGVWSQVRQENRRVHIIAHSFGAAVAQQLLRRIHTSGFEGLQDIQLTTLDPHEWQQSVTPVDEAVKLPNVNISLFDGLRADNYYQVVTIGSGMPAGRCVKGSYTRLLRGNEVDSSITNLLPQHTAVWRRYLHTILPDQDPVLTSLPSLEDKNWGGEWGGNTEKWLEGYGYSSANGTGNLPPPPNYCDDAYAGEAATDIQVMGALGSQAARYPFDQYRVFDGGFASVLEGVGDGNAFSDRAGYRGMTAVSTATGDGITLSYERGDVGSKIETNNTFVPADVLSFTLKLKLRGLDVSGVYPPAFLLPGTSYVGSDFVQRVVPLPSGNVKIGLFVPTPTGPWDNYNSLGIESGSSIYLKNTTGGSTQYCYPIPAAAQGGRIVNFSVELDSSAEANWAYFIDDLELSTQACPTTLLSVTVYSQADGTASSGVSIGVTGLVNTTLLTNANTAAYVTTSSTGALTFAAPASDPSGKAFDSWVGCDTMQSLQRSCNVTLSNSLQHRGIAARFMSPSINGVCGAANGSYRTSAPTANLCTLGNADSVNGTGPWTWTCLGSGGGTNAACSAALADTSPDSFTFAPSTNVPTNTAVISNAVTITGINTAAQIVVTNGQYSIGCNGSFSSVSGAIQNGQSLCVRNLSSPVNSTMTRTTLCVGGVCANFDVTTVAAGPPIDGQCGSAANLVSSVAPSLNLCTVGSANPAAPTLVGGVWRWSCDGQNGGTNAACSAPLSDTMPDAFSFASVNGVALGALQTSAATTITGINAPTAISVSGGSYSIGCTGSFVITAGMINGGQTVCVQHTTATTNSASVVTTLNVGGVLATFTSTTVAAGTTVNGQCGSASGQATSTAPSANLCVAGSANPAIPTLADGNWQWTCVGENGGTNAACAAPLPDTTPNPFSFANVVGVALNSIQTSSSATITGINTAAPISVSNGSYSIGCTGAFTTAPSMIANGQSVCVQHTAAVTNNMVTTTTVTVGGVSGTFSSTTQAAAGVSGSCGPVSTTTVAVLPNADLCATGKLGAVTGTGPWSWSCEAIGAGTSANCSANQTAHAVRSHVKGDWLVFGTGAWNDATRTIDIGDGIGYENGQDVDNDGNPVNLLYVPMGSTNDADMGVYRRDFAGTVSLSWFGCMSATTASYHTVGLGLRNPNFTAIVGSAQSPYLRDEIVFFTRWENNSSLYVRAFNGAGFTDTVVSNAVRESLPTGGFGYCGHFALSYDGTQYRAAHNGTQVWQGAAPPRAVGSSLLAFTLNFDNNTTLRTLQVSNEVCRRPVAASVEGARLLRYVQGSRGNGLVAGTVSGTANSATISAVEESHFLNSLNAYDFNGDGETTEVDAMLYLRYALGFRGSALVNNLTIGSMRTAAEIELSLSGCLPAQ